MSRQQYDSSTPESPSPKSSSRPSSAVDSDRSRQPAHGPRPGSEVHSSTPQSPPGVSSSSEGYPSWLPKRPPPPPPQSTLQSSVAGMFSEAGPSTSGGSPVVPVGRKPTPRSIRILYRPASTQVEKDPRREPTEQSRAFSGAAHARVWSRATSAALTPTLFSAGEGLLPRPRFRSPALHLELLRNPSWKMRLFYYLFPVFVFAHIPLQTFFDFNAVFILLLVAMHPNPEAPGVPGSGRNWALAAAAYIACWFTWIVAVFVVYEIVYSFVRRWRVKRPLVLPIYFSSPAFNFAAMSSYVNFCFMYYIRFSAFFGEHGSLRDGLAETFYFYSQNLPTVALLMPRAALSLALLFAFSSPQPGAVALADAGIGRRDGTFFRASDETLTNYARGVLIANAAWTAWRILVLLVSWIGLWIVSGQGCAGLCGPRYRWEEEDAEKTASVYHDNVSDLDPLPWSWKECTILRIKDAYDFCLTTKPARGASALGKDAHEQEAPVPIEGMERIFAAVGVPSTPHAARRGVLSGELFESPRDTPELTEKAIVQAAKPAPELSSIIPPAPAVQQREKQGSDPSGPLMKLPYPFTGYGAQVSSEDVVPFPPSPEIEEKEVHVESSEQHEGDEEEEEEDEEEGEEEEESEVPSSERRTSGSMSSLGRPIVSRYPFTFRRPRGSLSSSQMTPQTHSTPYSTQSRSTQSRSTRNSRSTQSTGNIESTDSHSPRSNSSNGPSPLNSSFSGSGIPMPPRHPQVHRRARAGTVPTLPSSPGSPSPVVFPAGRPRARTRTESMATDPSNTFGPIPIGSFESSDGEYEPDESLMDVPEAEGSIEEAERQDSVGLLSNAPSPRASLVNLRHRGSALSLHRRSNGSRSGSGASHSHSQSNSRSRTTSATGSESARSRAQSFIQSLGAASRSSLDLVRSRANSLARLSDSPYASTSSDAVLSSPENHTFGHPLREQWRAEEAAHDISDIAEADIPLPPSQPGSGSDGSQHELHTARSTISQAPSEQHSMVSVATERGGVPIAGRPQEPTHQESMPYLSTAPQSFVTGPATIGSATSSSGRTQTTWGAMEHYTHGSDWHPM
ncbi:hypothetical protein C8Q77DRAFT_1227050 [Trametes polyzona]|nr:hypothetical protein C8Q77DRAFT_1227050 [Trametes polyzona]